MIGLTIGATIFLIGLAKKVLLADTFAMYSTPVFAKADAGEALSTLEAWQGALAYSLQIYFDFSGYSDMAIGIARMLGLKLPINFASPYKAVSPSEFWRCWHITLSRFLRQYLYIPLGGNRKGATRQFLNLNITMILGGFWHGAGWGFLLWGLLHGMFLTIDHLLNRIRRSTAELENDETNRLTSFGRSRFLRPGYYVTLLCVIFAWVPFRAETIDGALSMWHSMINFTEGEGFRGAWWLMAGWFIVIFLPSTQTWMTRLFNYQARVEGADDLSEVRISKAGMVLAQAAAVTALVGLAMNNKISEFIYFQF